MVVDQNPMLKWSQFLGFFAFFIGFGFLFGIMIGIADAIMKIGLVNTMTTGYNALFFDAFLFVISLLAFKSIRNFIKQGLNFKVLKEKKTYLFIVGGILIFYASQFILLGLLGLDNPTGQPQTLGADKVGNSGMQMFLFILSIAVITPIKEEILYRGLLYKFLEVKYNFWMGILIGSLIFGLGHVDVPISAGIMGVVFILLYRFTKSLIPGMILHIVWNTFASLSFILS